MTYTNGDSQLIKNNICNLDFMKKTRRSTLRSWNKYVFFLTESIHLHDMLYASRISFIAILNNNCGMNQSLSTLLLTFKTILNEVYTIAVLDMVLYTLLNILLQFS